MINETLGLYLPDCVLDFTEHKRALICGGIGKEDARKKLQKIFGFESLTWNGSESGSNSTFLKDRKGIEAGAYDVVFLLEKYAGHHLDEIVLPAAKKRGIPALRISTGYNPNSFSIAIEQQVCRGQQRQADMARSSSWVMASAGRPVSY